MKCLHNSTIREEKKNLLPTGNSKSIKSIESSPIQYSFSWLQIVHMGKISEEVYLVKICLFYSKFGQSVLENSPLWRLNFFTPVLVSQMASEDTTFGNLPDPPAGCILACQVGSQMVCLLVPICENITGVTN